MIAEADKETKDNWIKDIVGAGTTEQWMNSDDRFDATKAAFQMARSLSAMAAGTIVGGPFGTYGVMAGEVASLYAMSYYEMKDEIDSVPGISEQDKVLMSAAYGVVGSVLERFGLSYLTGRSLAKREITNSILKSVFSKIPKDATKELIEAQIIQDAKMFIAQKGLNVLGSSIVEGGVEGTQRLAQFGVEEAYDLMKKKKYFNNKSAWEMLADVGYESYMGFLGGGIVSTAMSSGEVLSREIGRAHV